MTKKQHYMTRDERYKLEALLEAKVPVSRIAKQLGFCHQTIYNEIARGKYVHTYDWWDEERCSTDKGQQIHTYNQTAKGRPLKIGNGHRPATYHLELHLAWEAWSGPQSSGTLGRTSHTTHLVLPAVVMDGNAAEVFPVHIPPGSGRFCPGTVGQTERRYDPPAYGIWW